MREHTCLLLLLRSVPIFVCTLFSLHQIWVSLPLFLLQPLRLFLRLLQPLLLFLLLLQPFPWMILLFSQSALLHNYGGVGR
jgi:hypothetical protein